MWLDNTTFNFQNKDWTFVHHVYKQQQTMAF